MCLVKKPKVVSQPAATEKEPAILRNSYLDGIDPIIRAKSGGIKGLTIRRGQTGTVSVPRPQPSVQIPLPTGSVTGSVGSGSSLSGGGGRFDSDLSNLQIYRL